MLSAEIGDIVIPWTSLASSLSIKCVNHPIASINFVWLQKRKFSKSTTMVILFFWYLNLKPHNLHYSIPSHLALVLFPLLIWEFICISEHFNYMQWFYTWIRSRELKLFFSTVAKMTLVKIPICRCKCLSTSAVWSFL